MKGKVLWAATLAVGLTVSATAQSGGARQINTFINASKNVCSSVYRGDAAATPRDVLFSYKEGASDSADKMFIEKLVEKADLDSRYRVVIEPGSVTTAPGSDNTFLVDCTLETTGNKRWKQFLNNEESDACREAVKTAESYVRPEDSSRLKYLKNQWKSIKARKVTRRNGKRTSSTSEAQNMEQVKDVESKIDDLEDKIKAYQKERGEQAEQHYKDIAQERINECGAVKVTLLVPAIVATEAQLRGAKQLDGLIKITDFTLSGHVADRRDDTYCRNLMPRISAITAELTEMRRIIEKR